jgi:hypothetical protein
LYTFKKFSVPMASILGLSFLVLFHQSFFAGQVSFMLKMKRGPTANGLQPYLQKKEQLQYLSPSVVFVWLRGIYGGLCITERGAKAS